MKLKEISINADEMMYESGIARTWLVVEKENGIWIILNLMALRLKWFQR